MIPSIAVTDPQPGDSVTKGSKTRTVVSRESCQVTYKTQNGAVKTCWISTWREWCRKADSAIVVGQSAK